MEVAILIVTSRLNDVTQHEKKKSINGPNAHLTCLKQNNDVFNNLIMYTFLVLLTQLILVVNIFGHAEMWAKTERRVYRWKALTCRM